MLNNEPYKFHQINREDRGSTDGEQDQVETDDAFHGVLLYEIALASNNP